MSTWRTVIGSELGDLTVVRNADGLCGLYFPHHWYRPDPVTFGPNSDQGFDETARQLTEYLAGERQVMDLPLVVRGDALQIAVWDLVAQIPYGTTATYGELAAEIGGGITAQQIGPAVGRNPLSIIVPCHRVLGQGGKLTGYAGGLARKQRLLELEHDHLSRSQRMPFQPALITIGSE
jgi:methylated-DNA-[protein]-cysteine S-methyltransferase